MKPQHIPSKLDHPQIIRAIFCPRQDDGHDTPAQSSNCSITTADSEAILSCRFYPSSKDAPTILFFHGNSEIVSDYDQVAAEYTQIGINLFVATYRGYGHSSGTPKVSVLFKDNVLIFTYLQEYLQTNDFSGDLFVMGRSLGSASAIDLVYRFPDECKGLILDSGFGETLPLAKRLGFDISTHDIREEDCFNNLEKIRQISNPTIILHGSRDVLIPVSEAEKLQAYSGAKTKQFHVVPGADHNSLITVGGALYFETIKKFIDVVTGKNSWRRRRKSYRQTKGS